MQTPHMKQIGPQLWPTSNLAMLQQPGNDTHQTHRLYETHTSPHTYTRPTNPPIRPLSTSTNLLLNCLGVKLN